MTAEAPAGEGFRYVWRDCMFIAMLPDCRLIDGMVSAFAAGKVQAAEAGEQTAAGGAPAFGTG